MISSEIIRGLIDCIILRVIRDQDNYGYQIFQEVEKITQGKYVIKEATMYAALKRLEEKNYIISYMGTITHGRDRKYYQITKLGKVYLESKIIEWRHTKEIIDLFLEEVKK